MAYRTITVTAEACERIKRRKRGKESISDAIRRKIIPTARSGKELLDNLARVAPLVPRRGNK